MSSLKIKYHKEKIMGEKNIFQKALDRIWNKEGKIYVETPTPSLADFLFPTMSDEEVVRGVREIISAFHHNDKSFFKKYRFAVDLDKTSTLIVTCDNDNERIVTYTEMPTQQERGSIKYSHFGEKVLFFLGWGGSSLDAENLKKEIFGDFFPGADVPNMFFIDKKHV